MSHEDWIEYCRKRKKSIATRVFQKYSETPEEAPEYSTESVLDRRWERGRWVYKVKWEGYQEHTWEPVDNLQTDGVYNEHLLHFLQEINGRVDDNKPSPKTSPAV
eukprot:CAMPEP_0184481652 /NCGR_PEP_ID=MMETSP0113_2-20130426/3209_1 /TAXON_ID=91329 /ORGANISM="Norrisiella sphaerica, Strain BC52" /LENGTH=104 /DNA_ID=CAMNT_0026860895 /DNA_START=266 /DNA_END=580 /DNA_ORIENTATION=-